MLKQLAADFDNGVDITSEYTVYNTALSTTVTYLTCIDLSFSGLDGSGGIFEISISAGSVMQPEPRTVLFSTDTSCRVQFSNIIVPANAALTVKVKSPNAADTSIDYTVAVYDSNMVDIGYVAGDSDLVTMFEKMIHRSVGKVTYNKSTGVISVYDTDDATLLYTMAITESSGVETRARTDA